MTIVESWIVEDEVHDKSRKFGMEVPVGTWMVSMKVEDDSVWNDYVKTGKAKGFSIEGYFADRYQMSEEDKLINEIKEIIMREEKSVYKALFSEQEPKKVELESVSVLQKQIEGMKRVLKTFDGRIDEGEQYLKEFIKYRNFSLSILAKSKKYVSDVKMHKAAEDKLNKFEKAAKDLGVKVNNVPEVKEIKKLITETEEQIKKQKTLIDKFQQVGLK